VLARTVWRAAQRHCHDLGGVMWLEAESSETDLGTALPHDQGCKIVERDLMCGTTLRLEL
jgi:hypothetical protein